jgi:hypothetical protein
MAPSAPLAFEYGAWAHWARDACALHQMPEPARRPTQSELLKPTQEKLESQARTPAGAANAVRLALGLRSGRATQLVASSRSRTENTVKMHPNVEVIVPK